ncbi:unnamed protein product [Arabis nemorensis]|uniref:DRBM domain-containing protein n=1 Tax=Arabis nemorensis TaxID=586526 RepID=A0A565AL55_9BRAS|nr:unnamed protein product [Arabis nemorensis]
MEEVDCCLPVTKTTSESSDVCPTEDAIRALLENLVDPLLPLKPSPSDVPSKDLRESVAKQVHAVVLLYNYYHRKEHTHLEYLSFESFRSLTTVMRPALMQHLKESSGDCGDSEQTSLLEKVIVDACSLSMSLDASSDLSILKKWPIKKVAVLLVDSKKNTCYLQHSSITQGVWSLLEKEKTVGGDKSEEVMFQKVAFAAIKEATGVNHKDIVILERHLVYSLSEDKTTSRFYIMKSISQDVFPGEISIEEALNCMQGPLFEKSFSEWATNSRVDYFHVLPYANLIADWFSRREDTEFEIEKEVEAICDDIESNGKADATKELEILDILAKKDAAPLSIPKARKKVPPRIQYRNLRGRINATKETNVQLETVFALKAKNADNEMSPCKGSYSNGEKSGFEVGFDSNDHRERGIQKKKAVDDKLNSYLKRKAAPASAHNSNLNLEELQTTLLSRATSLSETALKVLHCKRDKLTLQQRYIEDELAKCDNSIKNIKGGNLELQLETILECCNDAYPRRILEESPDKSACQSNKRMKLGEPLPSKSLCQKLDEICLGNNWVLPNYRVSPSDGGFEAEVIIKETLFAYTFCGEVKSDAEEARESAAARLLTRLLDNIASNFS